jgi:5-methylcytosine-specific restriction endonuclease McrA
MISQHEFTLEYFQNRPFKDIPHKVAKADLIAGWAELTGGKVFEDPDRAIRKLHQQGYLVKVTKGLYKFDPEFVKTRDDLEDFSAKIKAQILERDGYKCVVCGKGLESKVDLHVDHIEPKDRGGKAILENGQTLCSQHNFQKKNLGQVTFSRKVFEQIREKAQADDSPEAKSVIGFANEVLAVFDKWGH